MFGLEYCYVDLEGVQDKGGFDQNATQVLPRHHLGMKLRTVFNVVKQKHSAFLRGQHFSGLPCDYLTQIRSGHSLNSVMLAIGNE